MLTPQELLASYTDPDVKERSNVKRPGWYTVTVDKAEERVNTYDPENPVTEINLQCRITAGPSKGVEFVTLVPAPDKTNPAFMQKSYSEDGEPILDDDGNPTFTGKTNQRYSDAIRLFRAVANAIIVGDTVKGSGTKAMEKRAAILADRLEENPDLCSLLEGGTMLVKFRLDDGVYRRNGEVVRVNEKRKENPRLVATNALPYSEKAETKLVLAEANLHPPKKQAAVDEEF